MRRVFAVAALLAASCGGSMSPTASTPIPVLPSGAYVLSVSIGGTSFGLSFCVSSGAGAVDTGALVTNVELQHTGNTVTIQPDDSTATFRMDLQMAAATVSGTASGQFISTGRVVAALVRAGRPRPLSALRAASALRETSPETSARAGPDWLALAALSTLPVWPATVATGR